jgi:hypothetical protein
VGETNFWRKFSLSPQGMKGGEYMQIQKTENYSQFKTIVGNRKVYTPHVRELEVSIQEKNMLQFNPIMVTKKMQVIDGQHRLVVAKNLKLPIYYVVMDDASLHDIKLLQEQRIWTANDYLQSYIALGNQQYIQLADFVKEYGLSIPQATLIGMNTYENPYKVLKQFRSGLFAFVDKEKAENMASLLNELEKACTDAAWKDREFLRALAVTIEKVSPQELVQKITTYALALTRRGNMREYLRQFEDIMNFRQRINHIRLD